MPDWKSIEVEFRKICEGLPLPAERRTAIPCAVADLFSRLRRIQNARNRLATWGLHAVVGTDAALDELARIRAASQRFREALLTDNGNGELVPHLSIDAAQALPFGRYSKFAAQMAWALPEFESWINDAERRLKREERLPKPSHRRRDPDVQIAAELAHCLAKVAGKKQAPRKLQERLFESAFPLFRITTKPQAMIDLLSRRAKINNDEKADAKKRRG